ncbi:TetR family transcriptional regulator [Streptomyces sp. NPDC089919]|uniref:TetR/AcrR family transcriptional regulator n=1 Tax=Streptomyces sp. NPDC089919 TaxID=3155188 RepID=UPI0034335FDC
MDRSRRDASARRRDIMSAAADLFARQGYTGTSLRRVARRAGCDPALIGHYFTSKQELYEAVVTEPVRPAEALREALAHPGPQTARRLLRKAAADWEDPDQQRRILGVLTSAQDLPVAADRLRRALVPSEAAARPDDELRMALIGSLFVGVVLARRMGMLPAGALPEGDREALVRTLEPAVTTYLGEPDRGVA